MADELARAFAFLLRADMGAERTEPSALGTARYDDRVPQRWDSNFLHVDRTVEPAALGPELERLGLRSAWFPDAEEGARVGAALTPAGWTAFRGVVMALRREPERAVDTAHVREVDEEALRALRRAGIESEPWGSPEVADQLLLAKRLLAARVAVRHFAVEEDGEVVSGVDLYLADGVAQVEDLATAAHARGRGHASALVVHAVAEARAGGAGLVFLVADADDWPQRLYERLGFEAIGHYAKLTSPERG